MAQATTAAPGTPAVPLSHREIMVILSGVLLAMSLGTLDQTIVTTHSQMLQVYYDANGVVEDLVSNDSTSSERFCAPSTGPTETPSDVSSESATRASASLYGSALVSASCARRSRAAETSFSARVIC